jgi:Uma2 family endonuclease
MSILEAPNLIHPPSTSEAYISYEDFQADYAGQHAEWEAGKVIPLVNNWQHQQLIIFFTALFDLFLDLRPIASMAIVGFQMKWSPDSPGREPDIMLILNEHRGRIQETSLDGVADVVLEVVSPESQTRDHITKYDEYAAAGVPEYWLIDPLRKQADIYHLEAPATYLRLPLDEAGRLQSRILPDFRLAPQILWASPLPKGMHIQALVEAMLKSPEA